MQHHKIVFPFRIFVFITVYILYQFNLAAQPLYSANDVEKFKAIVGESQKMSLADSSINKIICEVGKQFLGTPYIGGVLDKPENECLVVNLFELDCVTFLENTIALSLCIKEKKTSFNDFCNELLYIRYRDGVLNGYVSRLHYFYDWINNNEKKGVLQNITQQIGGKTFERMVNAMTVNRAKYPHLNDDYSAAAIKKIEGELTSMPKFYIPKDEIPLVENKINDGDIVALTTTVAGMEIAHVGIAIRVGTRLHLMNASSLDKKVEIWEKPLFEMIKDRKIYSGIVVARLR